LAQMNAVDDVPDVQADVVQRIVELVRDPGRQLAERRQLAGLDELLLLVAELLLAPLHLLRGLTQVAHDVDHRLAAVAQPEVGLMRVLEDVQHRLALVAELPVRLVQVAHDVQERAPSLLRLMHAVLELLDLLLEGAGLSRGGRIAVRPRRHGVGLDCHQLAARSTLSFSTSCWRPSSSFSSAIILSSRPTTTSSNFSRSRIFSCSSACDARRSPTTRSYARMSRRMPMAPITLPSASRSADALSVVGMISPDALGGLT